MILFRYFITKRKTTMSSNPNTIPSAKASSSTKGASTAAAGRPFLKNLTRARVPRAGIIGFSLAALASITWKVGVSDRHKNRIADFYK